VQEKSAATVCDTVKDCETRNIRIPVKIKTAKQPKFNFSQ